MGSPQDTGGLPALVASPSSPAVSTEGFDPGRDQDLEALDAWAFNVMLECCGDNARLPMEIAIGGAVLNLHDLDRILYWALTIANGKRGAK